MTRTPEETAAMVADFRLEAHFYSNYATRFKKRDAAKMAMYESYAASCTAAADALEREAGLAEKAALLDWLASRDTSTINETKCCSGEEAWVIRQQKNLGLLDSLRIEKAESDAYELRRMTPQTPPQSGGGR